MGNYNSIIAPRNYRTRQVLKTSYLDDIVNAYDTGFDNAYNDMRQIIADVFGSGSTYQLLQRGYATQVNPIIDIDTGISARDWIFTGDITLPSSFTVDQLGGDYTVSFANPASARTITFSDPGGNDSVAYLNATQTLSNKTFSGLSVVSPFSVNSALGSDSSILLKNDGADKVAFYWNTATSDTILSFLDSIRIVGVGSGAINLESLGGGAVVNIKSPTNTNPTLKYVENGTTKWSTYNNNAGDNFVLSNASGVAQLEAHQTDGLLLLDKDPPSANYPGTKRGFIGAMLGYVDNSGVVTDSYNIDSVISDDGNGTYGVLFDTNFTSDLAAVVVTPSSASLDLCTTVAMTGGGTSCLIEIYDVSGGVGADADFSLIAAGKFS